MKRHLRSVIGSTLVITQLIVPMQINAQAQDDMVTINTSDQHLYTEITPVNEAENDIEQFSENYDEDTVIFAGIDDIYFDKESKCFTVSKNLYCNDRMIDHISRLNKNLIDINIILDKRAIPLDKSIIAEATDFNTGAINYDVIYNWCKEICKKYCSASTMRAWDGSLITIPDGDGKYKIKEGTSAQELTSKVFTSLISFQPTDVTVEKSLPQRYIECDVSAQKIYWYEDGECTMSTDCVTGAVGTPTPQGTFTIKNNMGSTELVGPTWDVWVNNWAHFSGGCGLHDATWQSSFGLERWKQGYGSHGCINLPLTIANQMRSKMSVGDIIIIHC